MTDTTPPAVPEYGPVHTPPYEQLDRVAHVAALLAPLDGIQLGAYDTRVLNWLSREDTAIAMTVASLLHRARAANPPGRYQVSTDLATARALSAETVAEITGTPPAASVADLHRILADFLDRTDLDTYRSSVTDDRALDIHVKFDGPAIPVALRIGDQVRATHLTVSVSDPYFHIQIHGTVQGHPATLVVLAEADAELARLRAAFPEARYLRVEVGQLRELAAVAP